MPSVITGCAEFSGSQPPAPVYRSEPSVYHEPAPSYPVIQKKYEPVPKDPSESESLETQPLKEFTQITKPVEIEPEPLSPEQEQELLTPEQEQELLSLEQAHKAAETDQENAQEQKPPVPEATKEQPSLAPTPEVLIPPTSPPPPPPMAYAPLESFAPLSPVVGALVVAANKNTEQGNIDSATTTIERAIRIEPRNATLFYKLAVLRLKQSKPRLAEDLAKKSALLASNDTQLKKHSWLLIAKAREMQKNYQGAKEAKAKADKF
ncbi:MAG: tetratricopeptide repeat protein [Methylobacter sp.]